MLLTAVSLLFAVVFLSTGSVAEYTNEWCPPGTDPQFADEFTFCSLGTETGQQSTEVTEFHPNVVARFDLKNDAESPAKCVRGPKNPPGDVCSGDPSTFPTRGDTKSCKKFCDQEASCEAYIQQLRAGTDILSCYLLYKCNKDENQNGTCTGNSQCRSEAKCPGASKDCAKPSGLLTPFPGRASWTCFDRFEEKCDIYNRKEFSKCMVHTKCEQLPNCKDEMQPHFCQGNLWQKKDGTNATIEDWNEKSCECGPLYIYAEPGLALLCLEPEEPHTADTDGNPLTINGKPVYKISKGSCVQFCDGIEVHHIHCDQTTSDWTDSFMESTGPFFCWHKPNPVPQCIEGTDCYAGEICTSTGACEKACTANAECTDPTRPICSGDSHTCEGCSSDEECSTNYPDTPKCLVGEGKCVECLVDEDCTQTQVTPICNAETNVCEESPIK